MPVRFMRHLPGFAAGAIVGLAVSAALYAYAGPPASLAPPPTAMTAAEEAEGKRHLKWIALTIQRIDEVKPGQTRADLLPLFTMDGGYSLRSRHAYVYRACPLIKVDVEFAPPARLKDGALGESAQDVIRSVSRPYLDYSVLD